MSCRGTTLAHLLTCQIIDFVPNNNFEWTGKIHMLSADLSSTPKLKEAITDLLSKTQSPDYEGRLSDLIKELDYYRKMTHKLTKRLEQIEARATIDHLTKALNKSAYDLKVDQAIQDFHRYKDMSALMVIDIDYFKKINDHYGHKMGDQALISVASTIQSCIRKSDSLFRYGGEEFVVLSNKICPDNANKLAEKIRAHIEGNCFVGQDKNITVSIGVALLQEGDTEHSLFERADQAMYVSKHNGRNTVTMNC